MRCATCDTNKDLADFSGAQRKKPVAKRKCTACTAWEHRIDKLARIKASHVQGGGAVASCEARCADDDAHTGINDAIISSMRTDAATATATATATTTAAASIDPAATAGNNAAVGEPGALASGPRTRACSSCGQQLAGTVDAHQNWKKCGRCKQAFYCDPTCQRAHWKRGGHKQACKEALACFICLDNDTHPLPIQTGCGCRGEAGSAHISCKIKAARHKGRDYHAGWYECATCKQFYSGAMQLGLAEALWERWKVRREGAAELERLLAQDILASAYMGQGRDVEAEALYQESLATRKCLLGADDKLTLVTAANLGCVLTNQAKDSESEAVYRDTLERRRRVLGPVHENTLSVASNLAGALVNQGKYDGAETLVRATLVTQRRVLGDGHYQTLETCTVLTALLTSTGRHGEAEELCQGALAQSKRTLGPEHPHTLVMACRLARVLVKQGKATAAEALFQSTVAKQQRVLGSVTPHIIHRPTHCIIM